VFQYNFKTNSKNSYTDNDTGEKEI